jgi:hypothetical protein
VFVRGDDLRRFNIWNGRPALLDPLRLGRSESALASDFSVASGAARSDV